VEGEITMGDIDVVLLRLTTERDFRQAVAANPVRALASYQLTAEDRELLWLQARTAAPDRWSIRSGWYVAATPGLV
jgi:hypothetical protein